MNIDRFHTSLIGTDPTPEQVRLYQAYPRVHGYAGGERDKARFTATFVLGLYQTRDFEAKQFRKVVFAIPRTLDGWAIGTINEILKDIRERRKALPNRASGGKLIVEAIKHLEIGSRVFAVSQAPSRWVAFGFDPDSQMPEWVREGLLA